MIFFHKKSQRWSQIFIFISKILKNIDNFMIFVAKKWSKIARKNTIFDKNWNSTKNIDFELKKNDNFSKKMQLFKKIWCHSLKMASCSSKVATERMFGQRWLNWVPKSAKTGRKKRWGFVNNHHEFENDLLEDYVPSNCRYWDIITHKSVSVHIILLKIMIAQSKISMLY